MIEFKYLLSGVGYISKKTAKRIINDPLTKSSGFKRYKNGNPGASAILIIHGKTHQLDIHSIQK